MARATGKLHCRFCDWRCAALYTTKSGKHKTGWAWLLQHVMERHDEVPIDPEVVLGSFARDPEEQG